MWGVVANIGLGILCGHWIETRYSHNNSEYLFLNSIAKSDGACPWVLLSNKFIELLSRNTLEWVFCANLREQLKWIYGWLDFITLCT